MYEPREDSFLLKGVVEGEKAGRALDMGTGSGIIARELAKGCGEVVAADVERVEVEGVEFVESDLFENVEGKFDLITWNPPYLPGDEFPDLDCGDGSLIIRFFTEARGHLREGGRILLVISSLSPVGREEIEGEGYETRVVAKKKLAFEELSVLEAMLRTVSS